jgi:hypothetical protein
MVDVPPEALTADLLFAEPIGGERVGRPVEAPAAHLGKPVSVLLVDERQSRTAPASSGAWPAG